MSNGQRMHFGELLRMAREERMLLLSAMGATAPSRRTRELQRLRDAEGSTLVSIAMALDRLSFAPTLFGRCDVCDAEVPGATLNREPWCTRCADHAEKPSWDRLHSASTLPA